MITLVTLLACAETKPTTNADADKPWINDPTDGPSNDTEHNDNDSTTPTNDTADTNDSSEGNDDIDGDGFSPPIDCDDSDDWVIPQLELEALPLYRCGTGQALHNIESSENWLANADQGSVSMSDSSGCIGQALQVDYTLDASNGSDWVEVTRTFPAVDIGGKSFLLVPFSGDPSTTASDITFHISDGSCTGSYRIPESSHLGAWRPAIIPIQRFSGENCAPSLSTIESFGFTLSSDSGVRTGQINLDDITAINSSDLTPDIRTRFCPPLDAEVEKDLLASALLNSVQNTQNSDGHSFPEIWTGDSTRGSYASAMTLIALSLDYARTGDSETRQAAIDLAETFLALEKHQSGVWYEFYDSELDPIDDGNTPRPRHVSWVVIALHQFIIHAQPDDPTGYQLAMTGASDWLRVQQQQFSTDYPQWGGGLSRAAEDNISAYFAFVSTAAQDPTNLAGSATIGLGQFIWGKLWDVNQLRLRSGVTDGGFSSSVGSWGSQFLIHHNHPRESIFNLAFTSGFLTVPSWDEQLTGYALSEGPFQPSWEATGMMASAGGANAVLYLQDRLSNYNGGLLNGTPDNYLDPSQAFTGLQPTAWAYIGLYGDILSDL